MAKHNCAIFGTQNGLIAGQKVTDGSCVRRKVCGNKFRLLLVSVLLVCCLVLIAGCKEKPALPTVTFPQVTEEPKATEAGWPSMKDYAAEASLNALRQAMVETPQRFAVAYFGYHHNWDSELPVDPFAVMQSETPGLCEDLPFLLEIPEDRIVGEYGELFCIVPLDTDAQVSVSLGAWDEQNEEYIYEESLYFSHSGEPILLFCNSSGWEPDTRLQITGPSGDVIWYPQLDDNQCAMPLLDDNWEKLFFDFSAYREMLAANYRSMEENIEWEGVLPTEETLIGTTWVWSGFLKDGREASYRVSFEEDYLSVRWNDGIDLADHEYLHAPWELTYEEGYAVLSIDFGEFAGILRYNLMYSSFYDSLYVGMDVLQEAMLIGWEPLYRYLYHPAVPEPAEMVGTWELAWTMVEGDRNEANPGEQVIDITLDEDGLYRIDFTNNIFSQRSFYDKELVVFPFAIYEGCGNDQWSAAVNYTDPLDTEYTLAVLDDGMLMMQYYWQVDGAPMVGYELYRRIP